MPRKYVKKSKAKAKRAMVGKRRGRRSIKNVREYASLSVVRSLSYYSSGTMYINPVINLASFDRAVAVAKGYQRFRIKSVTLKIKPNLDSYTTVAAGSPQKPYVYFMIDKTGSIPDNVTLEGLKQAGAKPIALDEKPFRFTWQPAVHAYVKEAGGLTSPFSQYKVSPWLTTNDNPNTNAIWAPNTTEHFGFKLFIEQVGLLTLFNVDIECQFEFIKPLLNNAVGVVTATVSQYAILDASPDGVEGGSDGITIPLGATGPV